MFRKRGGIVARILVMRREVISFNPKASRKKELQRIKEMVKLNQLIFGDAFIDVLDKYKSEVIKYVGHCTCK